MPVQVISLSGLPLTDGGGFLPLTAPLALIELLCFLQSTLGTKQSE